MFAGQQASHLLSLSLFKLHQQKAPVRRERKRGNATKRRRNLFETQSDTNKNQHTAHEKLKVLGGGSGGAFRKKSSEIRRPTKTLTKMAFGSMKKGM